MLAVWYDDFRATTSHPEPLNGAMVLSEAGMYVGETLWVPDLFADASVRKLLENMIRYLLDAGKEAGGATSSFIGTVPGHAGNGSGGDS